MVTSKSFGVGSLTGLADFVVKYNVPGHEIVQQVLTGSVQKLSVSLYQCFKFEHCMT